MVMLISALFKTNTSIEEVSGAKRVDRERARGREREREQQEDWNENGKDIHNRETKSHTHRGLNK